MAQITRALNMRHLRSEPTMHVLRWRNGHLIRSGRGLAFWYRPLTTALAEIPVDDRDLPFLFHARSADYQDVTAQGTITFRVVDPEMLASHVDFSVDPQTGQYRQTPLEQVAVLIIQLAQQIAWAYMVRTPLEDLLIGGVADLRSMVGAGLAADPFLAALGIETAAVRVEAIRPAAEVEKALQMPQRERIQQTADEATFARRALAVEKERAIEENELQNRIELARREEQLVAQRGQNERKRAEEDAEARRIEGAAAAQRHRVEAEARADAIRLVQAAEVEAEGARMDVFRELPPAVLMGLAARELAGKLQRIDHVNVGPDLLGPLVTDLIEAGTARLAAPKGVAAPGPEVTES